MQQQDKKTQQASIENRDWKKLLKMLKLKSIQEAAPGFFALSGGLAMGVKPYTDTTANGLKKAIQDYINFTGGYCSNAGTMRITGGEMRRVRGCADLRVVCGGVRADITVKIPRDPARAQGRCREAATGRKYFVASSFPAFLEWWISLGFEVPDML